MVVVALLSGGAASSRETFNPDLWDVDEQECTQTYTNNDSIVFDNVTLVNGLLGFRVDWFNDNLVCDQFLVAQTGTLLTATLGYNIFANTATFDPGDLTFVVDTCE